MKFKTGIKKFIGFPHLLRRVQIPIILRNLYIENSSKILDIGCAGGQITSKLKQAKLVVGCEPSNAIHQFILEPNILAVKGDGLRLPFKDSMFDRILLSSVLQMIPQSEELLFEATRVLKNDGKIVLTVPIGYCFINKFFNKMRILIIIKKLLGLPKTYSEFLQDLNNKHNASGVGFYSFEKILNIIKESDLEVENWEYCPRGLATFFYEAILFVKYILKKNISVSGYFPLIFFPIVYFDRWLPSSSRGCEVIFVIMKKNKLLC